MKTIRILQKLGRALVAGFCIIAVSTPTPVPGCAGSAGPACLLSPTPCLKSLSLGKSAPTGMGLVTFSPGSLTLTYTLSATCPSCPTTPCAAPATPTSANVSVALYFLSDFAVFPPPACPPGPPVGAPALTYMTPVALPLCTPGGTATTYTVVAPIPAGMTEGYYCAYGTATVGFSDGMSLSASGDTVVCIAPSLPGQPGVPRVSVTLLSESAPRRAAGDVVMSRYSVRNNDPSNSVQLTAFAGSRQSALRPQGGNERQGVFSISSPFGDDFPIMFVTASNCIPLPSHPHTQARLSNSIPTLAPGQSNVITVAMRSYGQCANGSCSEGTLAVSGVFPDGRRVGACAGMAFVVNNNLPPSACARAVNDCNQNGIPDAIDIANGASQDRNFNAMPDECEQFISVPTATSVSPTNPTAGAPILVRVAFNEVVPMTSVWANGLPMTRSGPFWQATIPADTRPGPQTVYFLGKDQSGGLSTTIVTYQVSPLPRITRIYFDGSRNAIIEHNGVQAGRSLFVQENPNLSCLSCWTNRPSGPHASPHNAGPAIGTRFFRLHD